MAEKGKTSAIWLVSGVLAALFVASGGMKLAGAQAPIAAFTRYGYPAWFRLLIGVIEVVGALFLLVPRLTAYGTTALGIVMIGAAYTHVMNAEASHALVPLALLVALAGLAYARRPQ